MAPRRFKAHRQGCWIEATGSGLLRLRFRWRLPTATGLHKFSETTTLCDTAENRATFPSRRRSSGRKSLRIVSITCAGFRMAAEQSTSDQHHILAIGRSQMPGPRSGSFTQLGSREGCLRSSAHQGLATIAIISAHTSFRTLPTLPSRTSRSYISKNCAHLQIDRHLGLKTVGNVIDGSLRAMVRDARKAGVQAGFPFADFEWPRRLYRVLIHSRTRSGTDCSNSFFASISILGKSWFLSRRGSLPLLRVSSSRSSIRVFGPSRSFGASPPVSRSGGRDSVRRAFALIESECPEDSAAAGVVRLTARNVEV